MAAPAIASSSSSGLVPSPVAISGLAESMTPNLLTSEQRLIAKELSVPSNMLRTGSPLSLQANYSRYLIYLDTCQKLANIKTAGTWPSTLKSPSSMDIVLLFIGKSAWYDSWQKTFPHVGKYPDMVQWLQSGDDRKSDVEVWGTVQNVYNFQHLITWLDNGGSLVVEKKSKKGKEKEKVKVSHKAGSSKAGRK